MSTSKENEEATTTKTLLPSSSSSSSPSDDDTNNSNNNNNNNNNIEFVNYKDESQLEAVMNLVLQDLSEPYSIFTYRYFLHRFPELCILAINKETKEPIGCVVGKVDYEDTLLSASSSAASSHNHNQHHNQHHNQQQQQQNNNNNQNNHDNNMDIDNGNTTTTTTTTTSNKDNTSEDEAHLHLQQQQQQQQQNTNNINKIPTGYIGMLAVKSTQRRKGIGRALVQKILQRMKGTQFNCVSVTLETEVSNLGALQLYQNQFGFIREELLVRYYLNWGDAYRLRLWF